MNSTTTLSQNNPEDVNVYDFGKYNLSYKSAIAVQKIKARWEKQERVRAGVLRERESHGMVAYQAVKMWRQEMLEREKIEGQIRVKDQKDAKEVQQAIYADLVQKGHKLKKHSYILLTKKQQTKCIIQSKYKNNHCFKTGQPSIIYALVIEPKINLPSCYTYMPSMFSGFIVKNLSISNEHGTVTWNCPVDVSEVDFSEGDLIQIWRDSVEVSFQQKYSAFHSDIIVEFNRIPKSLFEHKLRNNNQVQILSKLKKQVQRQETGCRFVSYEAQTGHWFCHIILSKWKSTLQLNQKYQEPTSRNTCKAQHVLIAQ